METITINASLVDPNDPTEVNVVAAVAGVGTTHRLSTGQIIKWTPEFLRAKAHTFIGKPVNINFNADDEATDHSRRAIGTIKTAEYDEEQETVMVNAALWGHYYPKTVEKVRKLYADKKLNVSMELSYPKDTLVANSDGSQTPTEGTFSGMGFVGTPGDPRSMVYLMASMEEEEKGMQETSVMDVIKKIGAMLLGGSTSEEEQAATLSTTSRNDLPDSSFACPEKRKYPVKHKDGSIDLPHLRNAMARVSDPNNDQCGKDVIMSLAKKHLGDSAMAEILAEVHAAHQGSFEWLRHELQDHLMEDGSSYPMIIATYSNYAIYQDGDKYFRIDFTRSGDKLNLGEPQEVDPVYQPIAKASAEEGGVVPAEDTGNHNQGESKTMTATPEELQAAKDAQIEELKASLDAVTQTANELKAALGAREAADAAREAAEKATKLADERMAEIEKIVPVKDELKAALLENFKVLDDAAYEAVKASFAASAELRAGIAPGEGLENPDATPSKDEQKVPEATLKQFREEAKAQFGIKGDKSEDKE